ncbi:MAG: TolC family protein, partial [Sulfuricaulis sp.]|nr:TolC family protein [Sulfuricaulis sp.]
RAGLSLRIPLYQGGEVDAAVTRAASEQATREAQLHKAEYDLQKTVLDAVQELETLKVKRQAAKQRVAFRDLYLDRARAIYDMEVQISLGDAMTRLTEAQWLATKADFDFVLAWARIEALTGKLIDASVQETKP